MRRDSAGPSSIALLGDPDDADRRALALLLARVGCAVLESSTGDELLARDGQPPALAVLDVALAGVSAYECCQVLRERHGEGLPLVLVSAHRREPADEVAALLLGADDYILKPVHPEVFAARARRLLTRSGRGQEPTASTLTPREREVLALLVDGVTAAEIATQLCITEKTTATHIEHILAKTGAHSRAQAVAFAVRDRLLTPG